MEPAARREDTEWTMRRRNGNGNASTERRPGPETNERTALLEAILRERRRAIQEDPPERTMSPDPMDAAQEEQNLRVAQVTRERSRLMLAQVDEALRRLAEGSYGICGGCGEPIPVGRLLALPFAVRCVACQEQTEAPAAGAGGGRR